MSWRHERVEQLLASYALGGLDGEDAELAERALMEHVPGCDRCRRAWEEYRAVAADLALVAPAGAVPDPVLTRLRRSIWDRPAGRRAVRGSWIAGAAAAVVVVGISAWSLTLADRLSGQLQDAQRTQGWLVDAVTTAIHPSGEVVSLQGAGDQRVSVLYVPGEEQVYVMAAQMPDPAFSYHVWFEGGGKTWHAGVLEVNHGWGMMPVETDPDRWNLVMLTDEPRGSPQPQASPLVSASVD